VLQQCSRRSGAGESRRGFRAGLEGGHLGGWVAGWNLENENGKKDIEMD